MSKKKSEKPNKPWYKKWWGILLIIFVIIPAALAAISPTSRKESNDTTKQAPVAKATYDIKIAGNSYASTSQRRVTFTVTNTSDVSGNPSCFVKVESPEGVSPYVYGQDYVTWNTPLQPGERKYFEGLIDVSDNGASQATHTELNCS